jgi:hypothetical protein
LVDSAEAVGLAAIPLLRLVSFSCHGHSFFRRVTPFEPAVRLVENCFSSCSGELSAWSLLADLGGDFFYAVSFPLRPVPGLAVVTGVDLGDLLVHRH